MKCSMCACKHNTQLLTLEIEKMRIWFIRQSTPPYSLELINLGGLQQADKKKMVPGCYISHHTTEQERLSKPSLPAEKTNTFFQALHPFLFSLMSCVVCHVSNQRLRWHHQVYLSHYFIVWVLLRTSKQIFGCKISDSKGRHYHCNSSYLESQRSQTLSACVHVYRLSLHPFQVATHFGCQMEKDKKKEETASLGKQIYKAVSEPPLGWLAALLP